MKNVEKWTAAAQGTALTTCLLTALLTSAACASAAPPPAPAPQPSPAPAPAPAPDSEPGSVAPRAPVARKTARLAVFDEPVGPIWGQRDAEEKCPRACADADSAWNGQWRTTEPGTMSVCGCQGCCQDVETGWIRGQQDAQRKCPEVCGDAQGTWNGQWAADPSGRASTCGCCGRQCFQTTREISTGPLWSQQDAEQKCPSVCRQSAGRWNGQWSTETATRALRCGDGDCCSDVNAGPIFANDDAKQKCPRVCAAEGRGWNLEWKTTVAGEMSVCGCCGFGNQASSCGCVECCGEKEAGAIWDQRDAELKCPAACGADDRSWTGSWRTTVPGEMAVCGCCT